MLDLGVFHVLLLTLAGLVTSGPAVYAWRHRGLAVHAWRTVGDRV